MIFDKPFQKSEMLRRTIFKGRPNFFNAKDLNKELLIVHSYMEDFNNRMAIISNVKFTVANFSETYDNATDKWTRLVNITWTAGKILYRGIEFQIPAGGMPSDFTQTYDNPDTTVSPKETKPASYLCLVAELDTVTYADNPVLCGIQADEVPTSVPTVDVEQYKNPTFIMTDNPDAMGGIIAVIAVIHPRHKEDGSADGFGFLQYTMENPDFRLKNGNGNQDGVFKGNKTLFEYVIERISGRLDFLLNERQLIRRFNLADIADFSKARFNLGLSNLVNHRQLVQEENLRDLTDKNLARFNLGLGSSATKNVGTGANDIAPGNVLPVGVIMIWSGTTQSIPDGWKLCDGSNNTPDLRGRFVVGYGATDADFNLLGKVGGVRGATILKKNLPDYELPLEQEPHYHNMPYQITIGTAGEAKSDAYHRVHGNYTERQTQGATVNIKVKSGGSGEKLDTLPPYYVLCYIMFTGINITPPVVPVQPAPLNYPNFSEPTNATDNGYSTYNPVSVGSSGGTSMGSGIILTNPE